MDVTVFHNPNCSTSRKAVEMAREAGHQPKVVEYLKTGWTEDQLKGLLQRMGKGARDILRVRGTPAEELGLTKPGVSDATILKAMTQHPILVERPIVESPKGVVLGRPVEDVKRIL